MISITSSAVARSLEVAAEHREALAHGQVRVERGGLQDDADPLAPAPPGALGILAEHLDRAAVALAEALEDLDRRRLARRRSGRAGRTPRRRRSRSRCRAAPRARRSSSEPATETALTAPAPAGRARTPSRDAHSSTSAKPAVGKATSRPVSASTISLQSGWWPTATTVSPRPPTAARTLVERRARARAARRRPARGRRASAIASAVSTRAPQRARDDGVGMALGEQLAEHRPPRRGPSRVSGRSASGFPGAAFAWRTRIRCIAASLEARPDPSRR